MTHGDIPGVDGALAQALLAVFAKRRTGTPLAEDEQRVLLVAAYLYLEQNGHDLPPDELPELPAEHQRALAAAGPAALARALQVVKPGEDSAR